MLRSIAVSAYSFIAELARLVLIAAGAALGATFFSDVRAHPSLTMSLELFAVYAFYCVFAVVAAAAIGEGWLGIFAGHVPARFDDRAENFARGACDLFFAAGTLIVVLHPARGEAVIVALLFFAALIFGIGGAVPRIWFALQTPRVRDADITPTLLRRAGKEAGLFFYCACIGLGLGLAAAQFANQSVRARHAEKYRAAGFGEP